MSILSRKEQLNLVLSFGVASGHLLTIEIDAYNSSTPYERNVIAKGVAEKVVSDLECSEELQEKFREHTIGTVYAIYETARYAKKGESTDDIRQRKIINQSEETLQFRLLEKAIKLGLVPNNYQQGPSN